MAKEIKIKMNIEGNAEEALLKIQKIYDDIKKSADEAKKATGGVGVPTEMPKQVPSGSPSTTSAGKQIKKDYRIEREELLAMAMAGDLSSESFQKLQSKAAGAREQIDEINNRMKYFSQSGSEQAVNTLAEGVGVLGSTAQIAVGSMELLGISNKTAIETVAKLTAIESVMNGVRQIGIALQGDSMFMLGLENMKMKVLTATTSTYTAVVGTSTGAMKAFRVALAATGIGLAVVAVGALVSAFITLADASNKAKEAEENRNKVTNDGLEKTLDNIKKNDEAYKKLRVELLRSQGKDKEADALEGSFKQADINSLKMDADNLNKARQIYDEERIKSLDKIKNLENDITKIQNIRTSFGQAEKANINEQISKEQERLKEINRILSSVNIELSGKSSSVRNLETEAEITKNNARNKTTIISSKNKPETVQASAPKNFTLNISELGRIDQVNIMSDEDEKAFQQRLVNAIMGAMTTAQARVAR
jgi:hypothetical protein